MTNNSTLPVSNSTELCFLCRFDVGITLGNLDNGVFGLLLVLASLCCCCLCYSACMLCFCCVFNKQNGNPTYTPVDSSDD